MKPMIRYMKNQVTIIPENRELISSNVELFLWADGEHVVRWLYKKLDNGTVRRLIYMHSIS